MTSLSACSPAVPVLALADPTAPKSLHPGAAPLGVPPAVRSVYLLALQPPAAFLRPAPAAKSLPLEAFWEIARFSAPPSMEATLERWLQRLLGQERGFGLRWQVGNPAGIAPTTGTWAEGPTTVRLHQPNALRELALRIQTLQPFLESCGGSSLAFGFRPGQAGQAEQAGQAGSEAPLVQTGELAVSAIYLLRQSADGPLEQVAVLGLRP